MPSYLGSLDEMRGVGETVWPGWMPKDGESHVDFVEGLAREARELGPTGVPTSTWWGVDGEVVVGRIVLRHRLTEKLRIFGGHVSYEVRPSRRRQGVATGMLGLLLEEAEAREIGRLSLTCSPDNLASNRTILANGGVLERSAIAEGVGRMTNYYWILVR